MHRGLVSAEPFRGSPAISSSRWYEGAPGRPGGRGGALPRSVTVGNHAKVSDLVGHLPPCSGLERLEHEGRKDFGRLGSWMQPHIERLGEQVGQVGDSVGPALSSLGERVGEVGDSMGPVLTSLGEQVRGLGEQVGPAIHSMGQQVGDSLIVFCVLWTQPSPVPGGARPQ